jgi:hypothetical protein
MPCLNPDQSSWKRKRNAWLPISTKNREIVHTYQEQKQSKASPTSQPQPFRTTELERMLYLTIRLPLSEVPRRNK